MPSPTLNIISPPLPFVDVPVPIVKLPEVPWLVVPEVNVKTPLTPVVPLFTVDKISDPLEVLDPYPVKKEIAPPVKGELDPDSICT